MVGGIEQREFRDHLVAIVPPVPIRHRVGIDVPTAVNRVPVRIDRPEQMCDIPPFPLSIEYSLDCIELAIYYRLVHHTKYLCF